MMPCIGIIKCVRFIIKIKESRLQTKILEFFNALFLRFQKYNVSIHFSLQIVQMIQ